VEDARMMMPVAQALPWLTLLTAVPAAGALALAVMPARRPGAARAFALTVALGELLLALLLLRPFNFASGTIQLVERHAWIPALGVDYFVGADGLSLLMILLTAIVVPIGILASQRIAERVRLYFALLLLLETCLLGAFTALNFFHWFLYWEASLLPAFFLIRLWGGPKRAAAAMQFLVYSMAGSIALLLAFLAIFAGTHTFDLLSLAALAQSGKLMPAVVQALGWSHCAPQHVALALFAAAFVGFAVKVPVLPLHTWLPDAYTEAPTGTTVVLTGAMSKLGLYGMLRILLPVFGVEMQSARTLLLWLAVATIVLPACTALVQRDMKRIFAYSSINHLGYCLMGIFAVLPALSTTGVATVERQAAMNGVLLQMLNHGLTAAALFWMVALLEQRSGGLRALEDFGGLRKLMPIFAGLMGIAIFASMGLPGLNGFVGEFLIFKGVFPLAGWAAALALLGLLATAVFLLGLVQRVFAGPLNPLWTAMPDLSVREWLLLAPVIALLFALGLYPQWLIGIFNATAVHIVLPMHF
jgi:NADH-quinone oxidoreductase subunit M